MSKPIENLTGADATAFQSALDPYIDEWSKNRGQPISIKSFQGTDNERLESALSQMSLESRPLLIDESLTLSQMFDVSGYIDIKMTGAGSLNWVGGTANERAGLRARNIGGSPIATTTFSNTGISTADYPTGGYTVSKITVADSSNISARDVIYIKSDRTNEYSEASSGFAEIFHVIEKSGNDIYLSGKLERLTTSHGGSIFKLPRTHCSIQGKFSTDQTVNRQYCVWVEGYIQPNLDLEMPMAASSGLNLVSVYGGTVNAVGSNMRRDILTDTVNPRLGYLVATYGASKGINISVNAQNVYHAFTTSMGTSTELYSGHSSGISVTGIATGCIGHGFDTHMDDEGTVFYDIEVLDGHTDVYQASAGTVAAVQLRGHNGVVRGLYTNLKNAIYIKEWAQYNTISRISNVEHVDRLIGSPSSTNGLYTILFQELISDGGNNTADSLGNPITRNGIKNTICRNINGYYIDYQYAYTGDEWYSCRLDWSRTTRGWPGYVAGGGDHSYHNCKIIDPVNMNLGGNGTSVGHRDKVRLNGGEVYLSAATTNFTLSDQAYLESINHTIRVVVGNISTASYARTTISTGRVDFIFSNPTVIDGRAAGSVKAFDNTSTGGTININNRVTGPIPVTRTADTATANTSRKLAQCTKLLDLTGSISTNTLYTIDETSGPAGAEVYIRSSGGNTGYWIVKNAANTTLVNLATGKEAALRYDGSALRLIYSGNTPSTTP